MSVLPHVAPATLSERLLPLRGKRRGDSIQADEWNTIVQACLSILEMVQNESEAARARLEASFARREHEHVGEVSLSWLDPEMQQRLGGAVDAAGRSLVAALEKKVDALSAEVKTLQGQNAALESRLDRIAAADVDRTLTIRNLGKRVEDFGDFDVRLEKVSTDVTRLSPRIDEVIKLREALTDEQGNAIRLLDLRTEVRNLERLGSQLTGIDGAPVRITDIQQQIRDLRDATGLGQGLEPRLAALSVDLETRLGESIEGDIRDLRETLVTEQETRITNSVALKVDEVAAMQNNTITTRLSTIEQNVTQSILGTVRTDLEARGKTIDEKLATVGTLVDTAVANARPEIETSVRDSVTPVVLQEVRTSVSRAETSLNSQVASMDTTVTALKESLPSDIRAAVSAQTAEATVRILGEVDTKVQEARELILAAIPDAALDAAKIAIGDLDVRIDTAVSATVGDLDARVKTAVEAATSDLAVIVERSAKTEVEKLDVPSLVTSSTAEAEQRITGTVARRFEQEQETRTEAINKSVLTMRAEMAAMLRNG